MDIMKKRVVVCKKTHRVEREDAAAVVADELESHICRKDHPKSHRHSTNIGRKQIADGVHEQRLERVDILTSEGVWCMESVMHRMNGP